MGRERSALVAGLIGLAVLVSGCMGQESASAPADLFGTDQVLWYGYNLTQYYYPDGGGAPAVNAELVKVGTMEEAWSNVPAKHKVISVAGEKSLNYYDVYVNDSGKILAGNYTTVSGGFVSGCPIAGGVDYLTLLGYVDIAAALGAEKGAKPVIAGHETVTWSGNAYDCTVYNLTAGSGNYTIWHNRSLPVPPKIVVRPAGGVWVYELSGYGSERITGTSAPVPAATVKVTPVPEPNLTGWSGPSRLFDRGHISWYQYAEIVPMNDTTRRCKVKVEYGNGTYETADLNGTLIQVHQPYTRITETWSSDGIINEVSISENESGAVTGGAVGGRNLNTGAHGALGLDAEQARMMKSHDLSTWFGTETDEAMKLDRYENVRYNGDLFNCTVYRVNVGNTTYRVWHNASLPLPLKITVDAHRYPATFYEFPGGYQVTGPIAYELMEWG